MSKNVSNEQQHHEANKETDKLFGTLKDYLTSNESSPSTPGTMKFSPITGEILAILSKTGLGRISDWELMIS